MFDMQVDINPSCDELMRTFPSVDVSVQEAANQIAETARQLAANHRLTGRYAAGIVVQKSNRPKSGGYRVLSQDPKSSWMEFGIPGRVDWHGNPKPVKGYFIMRNAVEANGYLFSKKAK